MTGDSSIRSSSISSISQSPRITHNTDTHTLLFYTHCDISFSIDHTTHTKLWRPFVQLAIYLLYLLHLSSLSSLVTFANSLSSAQAIPLSLSILCCHWPVPVPRPHLSLSLSHSLFPSLAHLWSAQTRLSAPDCPGLVTHLHTHTYTPTEWLWSPPAVLLSAAVCCCCRHCRARLTATSVAITQTDRQTDRGTEVYTPTESTP